MSNITYGAVVGRFQTPYLHKGHEWLLDRVAQQHSHVIVVIGVGRTPLNATNPLPFHAREIMVREYLKHKEVNFTIIQMRDERSDMVWSQKLDAVLETLTDGQVTFYTGRDGFTPHYMGKYPVRELKGKCPEENATDIRRSVGEHPDFGSKEFRSGMIHAMWTKPFQTYTTVDMAMLRREQNQLYLLLARKTNESAWRFPGGFVEEERHETFTEAAAREMLEETGLTSERPWVIVQDFALPNEWRIRGQKGVGHRTVLMMGETSQTDAKAMDDIAEVRWFPFAEVVRDADTILMEEHRKLMVNAVFARLAQLNPLKQYATQEHHSPHR